MKRYRYICFALCCAALIAVDTASALSVKPSAPLTSPSLQIDKYQRCNSPSTRTSVTPSWRQELAVASAICTALLFFSPTATIPPTALAANIDMTFENGQVKLDDLLTSFGDDLILRRPQFLGSGGGGAVFAFDRVGVDTSTSQGVVVKVSWVRSAPSVDKECKILKFMENKHVEGVERCIAQRPYPADSRRTMIVMEPVVDESVASVSEIDKGLRPCSVRCIVKALVQMLAAGVVTTDVQPLISRSTGEVVFIDMTEARLISQSEGEPIAFLDMALASSFCSEMLGLIPGEFSDVACKALLEELKGIEERGEKLPQGELLDLIRGQATFLSREAADFIEARIL